MPDHYDLKITSAVVVDGEIRKAGAIVNVDERTAKDFLRRGKAELATAEAAPKDEPSEDAGQPAEAAPKAASKKDKQ